MNSNDFQIVHAVFNNDIIIELKKAPVYYTSAFGKLAYFN